MPLRRAELVPLARGPVRSPRAGYTLFRVRFQGTARNGRLKPGYHLGYNLSGPSINFPANMPLAEIHVTLKPSLFDAQGATILKALHQLGHTGVHNARIGKFITLEVESADGAQLRADLDAMCRQLLANPIIEDYEISFAAPTGTTSAAAGNDDLRSSTATSGPPKASSSLGADAFTLNYGTYQAMSTDSKLGLRSLALQKYGTWIRKSLRDRRAAWILCVGQDVVDSGDTLDTYPTEAQLELLGSQRDLVPWVFTRPPAGS